MHTYFFESIDDFYRDMEKPEPKCAADWRSFVEGCKAEMNSRTRENRSFFGCNYQQYLDRKYSYPEGEKKIQDLPGMTGQTQQASTIRTWHTDEGDDGDHERYLMELPHMIRRKKILRAGQRAVTRIVCNIGENASVNANEMLFKCFAACRIADQLENSGTRCEIVLANYSSNSDQDTSEGYQLQIIVKRPEEPINIALIAAVFTPWFYRCSVFQHRKAKYNVVEVFGHAEPIDRKQFDEQDIIIDRGECLTLADAELKIKSLDINQ